MRTLTMQEIEATHGGLSIESTNLKMALAGPQLGEFANTLKSSNSAPVSSAVGHISNRPSDSQRFCAPHQSVSADGGHLVVRDYPGYCVSGGAN